MFSAANDVFPFSQCCMKSCSKKNLIDKKMLFNNLLSSKRFVTEIMLDLW